MCQIWVKLKIFIPIFFPCVPILLYGSSSYLFLIFQFSQLIAHIYSYLFFSLSFSRIIDRHISSMTPQATLYIFLMLAAMATNVRALRSFTRSPSSAFIVSKKRVVYANRAAPIICYRQSSSGRKVFSTKGELHIEEGRDRSCSILIHLHYYYQTTVPLRQRQ